MTDVSKVVAQWRLETAPKSISEWHRRVDKFFYDFFCHEMTTDNRPVSSENVQQAYEHRSVTNFTGEISTIYALRNCEDVLRYTVNSLARGTSISPEMVQRFNRLIVYNVLDEVKYSKYGERPGEYKKKLYRFGENQYGSSPEKVPALLEDILRFMRDSQSDPLKVAAVSHCMFERVHPFPQGNGRTGRILLNYYLLSKDFPPIIFFSEDEKEYLAALKMFDNDGLSTKQMYDYLAKSLAKTWDSVTIDSDTNYELNMLHALEVLEV